MTNLKKEIKKIFNDDYLLNNSNIKLSDDKKTIYIKSVTDYFAKKRLVSTLFYFFKKNFHVDEITINSKSLESETVYIKKISRNKIIEIINFDFTENFDKLKELFNHKKKILEFFDKI